MVEEKPRQPLPPGLWSAYYRRFWHARLDVLETLLKRLPEGKKP